MKIAIVGDTHFGARKDEMDVLENSISFFVDSLFPYMKQNDIDTIIHLGDVFDKRKTVDILTLKMVKEAVFDRAAELGFTWHISMGNHDAYYRETNRVNTVDMLLREYMGANMSNINFYSSPIEKTIGKKRFLILPWITQENEKDSMNLIRTSSADFCFGHLEVTTFPMSRGSVCTHGIEAKEFSTFKKVFSGHFHGKNYKGNILYVGTPFELTWEDYGSEKGFHVLDLNTETVTFIKNENTIFKRIEYDPANPPKEDDLKGKYVQIVNKTDSLEFEDFVKNLQGKTITLDVIDAKTLLLEEVEEEPFEDIRVFIDRVIDKSEVSVDKSKLKKLFRELA